VSSSTLALNPIGDQKPSSRLRSEQHTACLPGVITIGLDIPESPFFCGHFSAVLAGSRAYRLM